MISGTLFGYQTHPAKPRKHRQKSEHLETRELVQLDKITNWIGIVLTLTTNSLGSYSPFINVTSIVYFNRSTKRRIRMSYKNSKKAKQNYNINSKANRITISSGVHSFTPHHGVSKEAKNFWLVQQRDRNWSHEAHTSQTCAEGWPTYMPLTDWGQKYPFLLGCTQSWG